jgi:hypothetical protein
MSDLEKFLQQAAQRMKERQQAAQQQARPAQPPPVQQAKQPPASSRPLARKAVHQGEIVDAEVVDLTPIEQGPNRLSKLDTRSKPGTANVSMADERMSEHLQQTFDHSVGTLPKSSASQAPVSTVVANEQTNRKIEVETQKQDIHWVTKLLQDPESLRSAFIASEIFKQRF